MNVYMVLTKTFYENEGKDYMVADALQPITVYSSYRKAMENFDYFRKYYEEKLGFTSKDKYPNLFPMEHITLYKNKYRVVIYIVKSEVE